MAITTPTVHRLYGSALQALIDAHDLDMKVLVIGAGEARKTLSTVERVCEAALDNTMDRRSVLVGIGGGVCTDVVSLAAASIRRGIEHVRIPTTLIGLVDAGIGLKGGVNLGAKKNFFGCFNPPSQALLDPDFLATLPVEHLRYGMAEILKMALVCDQRLFELCEAHHAALLESGFARPRDVAQEVLWRSIESMLVQLQSNPYENMTYQRLVDMGHTFSPLLEASTQYRLHHGDAVSIDMAFTVTLAQHYGVLSQGERDRFVRMLRDAGLPVFHPNLSMELIQAGLEEAVYHRGGALHLAVPTQIGRCIFIERRELLPLSLLRSTLTALEKECS